MKRLTITHREVTIESLREELSSSPEKRKALRILALLNLMGGKKNIETAEFLGCHRASIPAWVDRVNTEGLAGLEEKPGRGLKPKLTESERAKLKHDILSSTPKDHGLNGNLWTGPMVQEYIKRTWDVSYKQANIYVILEDLGITIQRPTKHLLGAKEDKRTEFKDELKKNLG